ncbi:MAG: phosphoenolpyruvate--protein phosphotransferase [Candidatus Schekmanbacteria bacterium]|nr:phosphoenolpyruvate--protein phosphotransferase [Candidatus Schekmanbacteria bacterium]
MAVAKTPNNVVTFKGIGVSPGIVIGKAFLLDRWKIRTEKINLTNEQIKKEINRFQKAILLSKQQLAAVKERLLKEVEDKTYGSIIDVHLMILSDDALVKAAEEMIQQEKVNAEWALDQVLKKFTAIFDAIGDAYLKERKTDIEHVAERVKRNLVGEEAKGIAEITKDVVVVAHDLTPVDTIHMQKSKVKGFATDLGGRTSHTAILARSLEIPAVVALGNICSSVQPGDAIIIDGIEGTVIVNPSKEIFTQYLEKQRQYVYYEKELLKLKDLAAETLDGYRIELAANIEFPEEVPSVIEHGAEAVGLYRTEFLYLDRISLPTEEEQFQAYKKLTLQLAPRCAVIRTLDIGGDKINPELPREIEPNPVLGLRAIRYSLKREDILREQLRAILRASAYGPLRMMLPLISGIAELRTVKAIIAQEQENLRRSNIAFDERMEIGVMIEVPSAAMLTDLLAKECDFFSIGTNDLIQYSIAIDRGNRQVAYLYEPLHPAVLRTIKMVVSAAHNEGIWVGMCGEMAGDPLCTPILLGLEIDELSMNAVSIPTIKRIVRNISRKEAADITYRALSLPTAKEVETYVVSEMAQRFPDIF